MSTAISRIRHSRIASALVVVGLLSSCGSDASSGSEASADPAGSAVTSPETVAETGTETQPTRLRDGITLTSGFQYETDDFDIPFRFTVPEDTDGRFRVFQEATSSISLILNVQPRNPDVDGDQQPGVGLGTAPIGSTIDDVVDAMLADADSTPGLVLERSEGLFGGRNVTIVSGTSDVEGFTTYSLDTSDETFVLVAQGQRQLLLYVWEQSGRPFIAKIDADPIEFDLMVKNGNAMLEGIEFT